MKTQNKVLLSLVFLLLLSFALVVPASAASSSDTFRFDYRINCRYTTDPLIETANGGKKEMNFGRLYVRHYLTELSGNYTNLFRGYRTNDNTIHGSKWCTPGLNIPIQSSSITAGTYKLRARGNTDYYTYMGQTSILVNGNCFYNQ